MTTTHIPCERIAAWAIDCLEASGVPHDDAETVATSLVQTSLWGIDSHGILRLTHYLTRVAAGSVKPKAEVLMRQTGPCTAQMAGDDGLGIVHCVRAMELAVRMAGASGAGIVGVGESSHCGAVGLYTRQAAAAHLIGIAFTHADSMVVPHGGNQKYFGTNPISIAFPRAGGEPVCLDMATSQVAWNKVMNARTENTALQPGLTVDADGKPTTDPYQAQALIPLGGETYGYKGYGLALMIDLLCGALNGMAFGPNLTAMYADLDQPRRIGHLLIAIDPKRFAGAATLEATVRALTDDLKTRGDILFAGEPEYRSEAERRTTGIPIAPAALADMNKWSARLGVAPLSAPLSTAAAA